jgi:hypothetical protein
MPVCAPGFPPLKKRKRTTVPWSLQEGPGTQIDGSFPKGRIVVVRWESMEALNKWRHSPEYEAARKVGEGFAKFTVVAVDGVVGGSKRNPGCPKRFPHTDRS